jgi:hypothetical protein
MIGRPLAGRLFFKPPQIVIEKLVIDSDTTMQGKCPKCAAASNIAVVPVRARDEVYSGASERQPAWTMAVARAPLD